MCCSIKATAAATPFSSRIRRPASAAPACMCSLSISARAAKNRSAVNFEIGIGCGPAPIAATRWPQKGWSDACGTTILGTPERKPAAVVPAPPWCMMALQRGNSHPCGANSRNNVPASGFSGCQPPHPVRKIARWPVLSKVARTAFNTCSVCWLMLLPKVMQSGGSPSARNDGNPSAGW